MIEVRSPGFQRLAARLTAKAAKLAAAAAENRARARRGDAQRWRKPRLLWPLFFAKDR